MADIRPLGSAKTLVEMSIDQVLACIQNGDIRDLAVYSKACVELGSAIDSAIGMDEVPSSSHLLKLLSVMTEVYVRKTDPHEPSLMLLMLPIKAACRAGWFPDGDIRNDLLLMANEVINGFSHTSKMIVEPSYAYSRVSEITSRFYPRMEVEHILTAFDAKAGYGTFIADFHISKSMSPHFENLWLLVARTDNMDTAACIASPSNVEFHLNGSGVPQRTKGDMGKGPQLPSNVARMIKYGVNLLEVRGDFEGQYTIAIAIMNWISSPDPPQLQDYVEPMSEKADLDGGDIQISSWISLNCPLSDFRIKTPVKGYRCTHPQCFDYNYFMAINSIRPTWKCPICSKPVSNLDIRIDQDVAKILNEVAENVNDVIISTDGSWMTSMTEKSGINETNRDTTSQNNHVTDITENQMTIQANDTIDNSSSALRNLGGSPVSGSAQPPCTSWQSTETTPAVLSSSALRNLGGSPVSGRAEPSCTSWQSTETTPAVLSSSALRNLGGSPVSGSAEPPCTSWQSTETTPAVLSPPVFRDPRLPPLVMCDPVVPPSSTHHMNSVNLTTRSTTQVPYSLINPNHPSSETQPQKGQADRATQADFGKSTTEQSQGAPFITPSATNSQHSIPLDFNQLRKRHEQQHYNAPVQSQVNLGKTAQAQSTTFATPVKVMPSATISPPSKQLDIRGEQQHYTTIHGKSQVNVGTTANAQRETMSTSSATSSQDPITLPFIQYCRRGKQQHYTASEQSQVNVDITKQAQNTTMLKPDTTSSPQAIGLAVGLAFEHLKRGDGLQHYTPPGQSQPEVGTTKLAPSIARPFKLRRVDELRYGTSQSPANSGANNQAQDTTMFTPVCLPPSAQVVVQLRKRGRPSTRPTTKTPSLDCHLVTARTSMLGQDVQQHYTTPCVSKVNVGKSKQVQSTTMLPPAAISSMQSIARGYKQQHYTPSHSQAQFSNERPMLPPPATSSMQSIARGYKQQHYTPSHSQAQFSNERPMLPPPATSSMQSTARGYKQQHYTPSHSQAQFSNERPMLPPPATSSLQSIARGYERHHHDPGRSQAQSLNERPMSPPSATSSFPSIPPGYENEQRRYTPGNSEAQFSNETPMLPPSATSSLQSIPPGYEHEQRRYTPGNSQAQSLNERSMSQTRLPEAKGDAPPRQPTLANRPSIDAF